MIINGTSTMRTVLDHIIIQKIEPETKTIGSIELPESFTDKNTGKVLAVGPGKKDEPMLVKKNDVVMYYGGVDNGAEIDREKKIYMVRQEHILAIL